MSQRGAYDNIFQGVFIYLQRYHQKYMKKQELIHLHSLLSEVHVQCEKWNKSFEIKEYESLGIKPTSIHKSKTDHKDAVFKLAEGIKSEINDDTTESADILTSNAD